MRHLLTVFVVLIFSATFAMADDAEQVITLKDGSQIKGVLAGVDNGIYTVKTPIIGDVHVSASDVASITNSSVTGSLPANTASPNSAAPSPSLPPSSNFDAQVAASQQRLMSDPQSMEILKEMAQNPEIAQALQDPTLVQAVTNHNYQAVASSPAVQKLMSDPQMQALLQKLAAEQQQQNSSSQ